MDGVMETEIKIKKIENSTISDVFTEKEILERHYINCTFECFDFNVSVGRCIFEDCKFETVSFYGSTFDSCTFKKCSFKDVLLLTLINNCKFSNCNFVNCSSSLLDNVGFEKEQGANYKSDKDVDENAFQQLLVSNTSLLSVKFEDTNLKHAVFYNTKFSPVRLSKKIDFRELSISNIKGSFHLIFENNSTVLVNEMTSFPSLKEINKQICLIYNKEFIKNTYNILIIGNGATSNDNKKELMRHAKNETFRMMKDEYKRTSELYYQIASIFRNSNLQDEYGQAYYVAKRLQHKTLVKFKKFKSYWSNSFCGHGERWYNGLFWSAFVILACSFIYMTGIVSSDPLTNKPHEIQYTCSFIEFITLKWAQNIDWVQWFDDLKISMYFSMMTFTTVGYGNIQAIGGLAHVVSFFQMFFGVILMTVTTGSLLRKLFR